MGQDSNNTPMLCNLQHCHYVCDFQPAMIALLYGSSMVESSPAPQIPHLQGPLSFLHMMQQLKISHYHSTLFPQSLFLSSIDTIRLEHTVLQYEAVYIHTQHTSIPSQSSLLHTVTGFSYTQFVHPQVIYSTPFMHINTAHPVKHACFISL